MKNDNWYIRDMQDAKRGGIMRGILVGVLLSIPLWAAAWWTWRHFT